MGVWVTASRLAGGRWRRRSVQALLGAAFIGAALIGCAERPPAPLPMTNGRAVVLGPEPGFDPAALPQDWFVIAPDRVASLAVSDLSGVPVLRIDPPGGALIGRRLEIPILATPYLHAGLYLDPALYGGGPGDGLPRGIRLVIGFKGGTRGGAQLLNNVFGIGSGDFPPHERLMELRLEGQGVARPENAMIEFAAFDDRGVKRVLTPSAYGQAGRWHLEAVDLSRLYSTFWPRDRIGQVEIAFVAVGGLQHQLPTALAESGKMPSIGYVAEILLTR